MAENWPDKRPRRGSLVLIAVLAFLVMADGQAWSKVHWGTIKSEEAAPGVAQAPSPAEKTALEAMNKALYIDGGQARPSPRRTPGNIKTEDSNDFLIAAASAEIKMRQALAIESVPATFENEGQAGVAGQPILAGLKAAASPFFSRAVPPQFPTMMNDPRYLNFLALAGANSRRSAMELSRAMEIAGFSLSEVEMITGNLRSATAEYVMAAGVAAADVTAFVGSLARQDLRNFQISTLPNPFFQPRKAQPAYGQGENESDDNGRFRLWGGYLGRFRSVDATRSYYGYDQNTNGAILGAVYDFGPTVSLGIYTGYTSSKVDFDALNSDNRSSGIHVGLVGRLAPYYQTDPGFSIYGDLGYASYSNKGRRRNSLETIKASFDQKAFTAGLGVDYVAQLNFDIRMVPSLDLRYTRLIQDDVRERGFTPVVTRTEGFNADSITATVALSASTVIDVSDGAIVPVVKAGWQHEYGDRQYRSYARYSNLGLHANPFRVSTVAVDRDTLIGGLGFLAVLDSGPDDQVALNLSYDFAFSKNSRVHSLYGGLEYRF